MKFIPEKLYRKIRYHKGHGVHSPFAYNFITNVIEEKLPYYIFEDIERKRRKLLACKDVIKFVNPKGVLKEKTISEITSSETQSNRYGALLFRFVNFLQCKSVLQIGASTGIMTLYMAAPRKDMQCVVLEDREELIPVIQNQSDSLNLNNVKIEYGEYTSTLCRVLQNQNYFDMVFLNTARNPVLTQKILDTHIKTRFLVIDGIRKNKNMKDLWQTVTNNPQAKITIDLYYLGIALFEEKFYKKHYKAHFDNGKRRFQKQNLYKIRRRGLYFFNRRKKNSQK